MIVTKYYGKKNHFILFSKLHIWKRKNSPENSSKIESGMDSKKGLCILCLARVIQNISNGLKKRILSGIREKYIKFYKMIV